LHLLRRKARNELDIRRDREVNTFALKERGCFESAWPLSSAVQFGWEIVLSFVPKFQVFGLKFGKQVI